MMKKLPVYIMNLVKKIFCIGFIASFSVLTAQAASSEWQDLGGGQARLVANLDPITNKISGVIEVNLKPGWSTYWRYPGSSGIPPKFDFTKSQTIRVNEVQFPTPKLITSEFGSYAGYKNKVLFPFEANILEASGGEINLDLLIGVCERVCIPAKAEMIIKTNDLFQSDPQAVQIVSFAKLSLPKKVNADDVLLGVTRFDSETIYIKTNYKKSYGTPALFVEGPYDWYLTPPKLTAIEGDYATFALDVSRAPKDIDIIKQKLKYTLAIGSAGIEIQQ